MFGTAPSKLVIKNSKGLPVELNEHEKFHVEYIRNEVCKRFGNDLGFQIDITTLTTILASITEQKFYQIPFADFMPVQVGQGAWSSQLTSYRTFALGDDFADGLLNTGSPNGKLAAVSTGVDAVNIKVNNWAKGLSWSIFDLKQASLSGNWDLVTSLEKSRKTNWDLGIQQVAFLGLAGQNGTAGSVLGLLNQPGASVNSSVITQPLSAMTSIQLSAFCQQVYEAYRANCNRTAVPTHFIIPESDYNGLAAQSSPEFPIKSKLAVIEEMFKKMSKNEGFKVMSVAYADAAYHQGVELIANKQVYTMFRYDETSLALNIPVDYTSTLANSVDNFNFNNAAYGQFTGVLLKRPLEMLYFTFNGQA